MPRQSAEIAMQLQKARESALLAVETYNRPQASFRSGGFIVMMCIAWTALLHAVFHKRGTKPFYRKKQHRRHFEMLDGDRKAWELSTCIAEFWKTGDQSERANIDFFIKLRNKIEHRSMPALDVSIFGECQALLFNFEDLLVAEFGEKAALNESLSLSLQFSRMRCDRQDRSIRKLHSVVAKDIAHYIDTFRSSLGTDVLQNPRFSYKVFLIPKPANQQGSADLAVEFVKFDPSKPEEMARYERVVALIKPGSPPTINPTLNVSASNEQGIAVRLVNDLAAPAFRPISYDDDFPYRQKEVKDEFHKICPGANITTHDVLSVRKVHSIESDARYFFEPKFGSPQYSKSFVEWLASHYREDNEFFAKSRSAYKAKKG